MQIYVIAQNPSCFIQNEIPVLFNFEDNILVEFSIKFYENIYVYSISLLYFFILLLILCAQPAFTYRYHKCGTQILISHTSRKFSVFSYLYAKMVQHFISTISIFLFYMYKYKMVPLL